MKSILFNAFSDEGHSKRLDVALDLARSFDASLTVVSVVPYEVLIGDGLSDAAFAAMIPIWREEARELREQTEQDLANEGVSWRWIESSSPATDAILEHSPLADLIIIGARDPRRGGRVPSHTAGDLAILADCPVLVLPEAQSRFDITAPALVAWDGSPEASHALKSAVPFLKESSEVFFASVKEKKDARFDLPPVSGADYLSRYGIRSEIVETAESSKDVATQLTDAALARRCGLIVMGAYGRMRLAERIFGGVTRSMLTDLQVPLLLRH